MVKVGLEGQGPTMRQKSNTEETRELQLDTEQAIRSEGSLEPAFQPTLDESLPGDFDEIELLLAGEERDVPSEENDDTQYKQYSLSLASGFSGCGSFAVSPNSVECKSYNGFLDGFIRILTESETEWLSVDCLGRIWRSENGESKIRTTVVVTFTRLPAESSALKRSLQGEMSTVILPIEFLEGRMDKLHCIDNGFMEPRQPLECGASCGPVGQDSTGSLGGFIMIKGDPDPNVYAVTNHHVIAMEDNDSDPIAWVSRQNIQTHLGLQRIALGTFGLQNYDKEGIATILHWLQTLDPPFKGRYADGSSYLRDFAKQYTNLWESEVHGSITLDITDAVDRRVGDMLHQEEWWSHCQSLFSVHIRSLGLNSTYLESAIEDDMGRSLTPHHYEVGILLIIISESLSDRKAKAVEILRKLIFLRQLCRNPPNLSRVIEHPSLPDRKDVLRRLAERLTYSQNCVTFRDSSGENWGENMALNAAVGQEQARHREDAYLIDQLHSRFKDHARSAGRLAGIVWASSGDTMKTEYNRNFEEDWALINLFRNANEQFRNVISNNILRPSHPDDRFQAVKRWTKPIRIEVTKRGRTTNCTMGTVNGAPSGVRYGNTTIYRYGIVSGSTNGYFSQKGDSGSWIMDRNGQLIGMMHAGRTRFIRGHDSISRGGWAPTDLEFQDITYFTPATFLFKWIQQAFEGAMREQGVELTELDPGERIVLLAPGDQFWG